MDNMRIFWVNSLFIRLLVAIIVFIMVPVYIIGMGIYNRGISIVNDKISKSEVAQTTYFLKDLENEIERIRIQQYDCMTDEHLNKLNIAWDVLEWYDRSESVQQLQHRLFSIKNSSKYIKSVTAYIIPINKMISDSHINMDVDMEKYSNIRIPVNNRLSPIVLWNGKLYMTTSKSDGSVRNDPSTVIEIELDSDVLRNALASLNLYENSGAFLISASTSYLIGSSTGSFNNAAVTETIARGAKDSVNSTYIEIIGNERYFIATVYSSFLGMTLCKYLPVSQFMRHFNDFYVWAWIYTIVVLIVIVIYSFSTYRMVHKPLTKLVRAFNSIENGDLSITIERMKKDEFAYIYNRFNIMMEKLNTLIEQVYKQRILTQRAELKQLQSQINPHFLYNSFFVISTMARVGDNEGLETFSIHLGEYFKYITRSGVEEVPLRKEVDHACIYTEIQSARFSNRIKVIFEALPEKYAGFYVPRLIIQPVIENAFEYGMEKMLDKGVVRISFQEAVNKLIINVEDNGEGLTEDEIKKLQDSFSSSEENMEVTGISNIHRRLQLKFGPDSGLAISKSELGGLKVSLIIVLEENACTDC
jgi:two-component system, sensor histidine kinase YesM